MSLIGGYHCQAPVADTSRISNYHRIGVVLLVPFVSGLILLGGSALLKLDNVEHFDILIMMVTFLFMDLAVIGLGIFGAIKAALMVKTETVGPVISYVKSL